MFPSFNAVRRIVHGFGALQDLGGEIKRLGGSRVLIITDPGIKGAGILDAVRQVVENAGFTCGAFAEVESDPRVEVVAASLEAAKTFQPNLIVGVGGGSSLDISKVTSVMLTNGGQIDSYFGMELVPSLGVPHPHAHHGGHGE